MIDDQTGTDRAVAAASVTAAPLTVSRRSSRVRPFEVMTILNRVFEMRAEGRDVISLCVGEPQQGAPADVRRRAAEVVLDGTDLGYSEVFGIVGLRERIAEHYRRWYGVEVPVSRIAVTSGSSGAFDMVFLASFDAGDRVALATPGYPAYTNILRAQDVEVVELPCGPDVRFQPTVEMLEAAHRQEPLKGLMLASPANPTGTMISREELAALAGWCAENGVRLISDEIYHGVTFGSSKGTSLLECSDTGVVISSFSKYWGMTGWRLGWAILPEDLVKPCDDIAGNLALCPPVPAQHACVEAFTEESYAECDAAVAGFARARQLVLDAVEGLGWTNMAPADGAFYMYFRIDQVLGVYRDATAWCAGLLEREGVALAPGLDFDPVNGRDYVRLSLAAGPENIAEALTRIRRFQDSSAG
ncbi:MULTISPECIES: pyridoxal phosphate-dependent aminotransferase [Brevibacterium]|uniref:Aminotransferase n=1 Tax=Brevibacterium salitolerans TaxID=1403566 RepID=A0ABN2WPL7_9MICO|nr:aminotransferase class I/II-fold pyridoxal phosphate-dependent enzyme [Brevibacterium sp.]